MSPLALSHLPLFGYFALIGGLLVAASPALTARKPNAVAGLFFLLALASLGSTWSYMFAYFRRSFEDSAARAGVAAAEYSTQAWLNDVSLFHEAWHYVCETPQRWWWSEQLCLWTVGPLTLLMTVEGRRHGIKRTWAFMLLGQVVAVSFAQSLFFAAVALAPPVKPAAAPATPAQGRLPTSPNSKLTWWLLFAVIAGNASVAFTPRTLYSSFFLPNLLLMHAVLLAPLVIPDRKTAPMALSRFYLNISLVVIRFRAPTVLEILGKDTPFSFAAVVPRIPELLKAQWDTLNEHPAQQSIGWDVVFASISALVYLVWSSRQPARPAERVSPAILALLVLATPLVGVGTAVGLGLAIREGKKETREDAEKKLEEARRAQAVQNVQELGTKKKQ
ncbi:hypothetical protein JCM10213_005119 [Rhodosporidiobolus nylandii]